VKLNKVALYILPVNALLIKVVTDVLFPDGIPSLNLK
jgi:hypothetical protein